MMRTNNVYASDIKGYCSVATCWQFLYDIAKEIDAVHCSGKGFCKVDLRETEIHGNHFTLNHDSGEVAPESSIWELAAAAMELMLGSPIFNGEGEMRVTERSPIPQLPHKDADSLNRLLSSCLSHDKEKRPKAAEIAKRADAELKALDKTPRQPRVQNVMTRKETTEKIDRQWPEAIKENLTRVILLLLLLTCGSLPSRSQTLEQTGESELIKLREAVLLLRQHDAASWEKAQDEFKKRINTFTLMDELQDTQNDCLPIASKVKKLGVNRMITELKNGRRVQNSEIEMLDGSDLRFSYSIFEKCIKNEATARYTMTGRNGKQVYMIIPYRAGNQYSCELTIGDGRVIEASHTDKDGITYYFVDTDDGPETDEQIILKISNKEKTNASFVIINHNYRNK